jgi:hypothetical protein
VDVDGHQNLGVKVYPILAAGLTEPIKVEPAILFREETGSPVVAPLDEVHGNSR